ncbi:MAG: NAD-dependent epimerase/dehydratase family protein [Deltaproteobacteria bacterium]|nr:NAD-dependent epimerase/dehydratase family protein [Deltaproteobacteria bacterium]
MKILVTGGAGFIGSHLADRLLSLGHQVAVIDNLSSGHRSNVPVAATWTELDIRSEEAARHIQAQRFEAVFHLAAQIDVRKSVADPRFDSEVNVGGLVNVVEAARRGGALQQVVFASTGGALYGEQEVFPAPESHPIRPLSPYGVAKACGEQYLGWFERAYGLRYTALRFANVYGPRQDPLGEAGVVAIFARKLLRGETAVIYGDGEQTRDFVFVQDVVEANVRALERRTTGAINVGTGVETSVNDIYRRLARLAGFDRPARREPARPGEQLRSVIAADRCQQLLGFRPSTDLDVGLGLTLDHFRAAGAGAAP